MGAALAAQVLLLAAGRGKRAGGPKAWRDGALEKHLAGLAGVVDAVSASIQAEWLDRCRALSSTVRWVAADPDASPLASLQRLLEGAPPLPAFVYHVDMPVYDRSMFETLLASDAKAPVAAFNGRRGHPVLLRQSLFEEVRRLDPETDRLDHFLKARGTPVDMPFPEILENRNA